MKSLVARILFAALVVLLVAPPAARAAQKIKITVPALEGVGSVFYVAQQKGYFAAEGLDVELEIAGGGIATPALLSGSIDGSASSASALSAMLRDAPLRIVLVFYGTPLYKIVAVNDIRTLADLKGKSVGVQTRGDTFEIATRLALQSASISPDSVGYSPLGTGGNLVAAIATGAMPAVVLSPSQMVALQEQGLMKNVHVIADLSRLVRMPLAGYVVSQKLLGGDSGTARKMVRAIIKGMRYERAYKKQTVAILVTLAKDVRVQTIEAQYDEFAGSLTPDGTIGNEVLAPDLNVRAALMSLPKEQIPALEKLYDFSIARAVNAELDAAHWRPTP